MASFRVLYGDGSAAKNTKVSIAVDGGGMANGYTDDRGYVTIPAKYRAKYRKYRGRSSDYKLLMDGMRKWGKMGNAR